MNPEEDEACRATAEEIQEQRPGWLVIWGVYSRQYIAYPLFPLRRRVIVVAHHPGALVERIDSAEKLLRPDAPDHQRHEEHGVSDSDTSDG